MTETYATREPTRAEVEALPGATLLEFGSPWCGYCRAAQPLLVSALAEHPNVRHIKVGDGRGKPLGRSYKVRLWPTLVFLTDGREAGRLVRPGEVNAIREALARIDATP